MISTSTCRVYYSGLNSEFCLYLFTTIWLYLIFIVFIITFIVKYFLVTTNEICKRIEVVCTVTYNHPLYISYACFYILYSHTLYTQHNTFESIYFAEFTNDAFYFTVDWY